MDDIDLTILRTVQKRFPQAPRPYEVLARELGMCADEVHGRISALRRHGVIRRLGPLFDSRKLGHRGHLVAARAEPDAVQSLADLLDRRPEVTHNYLRAGHFNVWFTVVIPEENDVGRILHEVRAVPGVREVVVLPTRKIFKLDASFEVRDNGAVSSSRLSGGGSRGDSLPPPQGDGAQSHSLSPLRGERARVRGGVGGCKCPGKNAPDAAAPVDEADRRIIRAMQKGLSDSMTPYADAAGTLGMDAGELIRRLERMRERGVLRGVRAVLDQRRMGFEGNVLVAWAVPSGRTGEVGQLFALRAEVSHCVLREAAPDWPCNLYTMIHAESALRCRDVVKEMARASGIGEYVPLETVRELKKSPPEYF